MNKFLQLIFILFSLSGCLNDDESEKDPITECTYDLGQQSLTSISKNAFPYAGIKNVIFVDSFGIQKNFELTFADASSLVTNSKFIRDTVLNGLPFESATVTNCMYDQSWIFTLRELGGPMILVAKIYTDFDLTLPTRKVVDKIEILLTTSGRVDDVFPYFKMVIDKRESTDGYLDMLEVKDEFLVYDKTFKNVINSIPPNPQLHKVYYNKTEGIVAFTEANGKKWIFDKMF
jgi:hypothetical protein